MAEHTGIFLYYERDGGGSHVEINPPEESGGGEWDVESGVYSEGIWNVMTSRYEDPAPAP